jgi:hypothetical protein
MSDLDFVTQRWQVLRVHRLGEHGFVCDDPENTGQLIFVTADRAAAEGLLDALAGGSTGNGCWASGRPGRSTEM